MARPSQDKAHGQIVTGPENSWDINGTQIRTTTIKINYNQQSKLFTVRVMVRMSHVSSGGAKIGFASYGQGLTNDYSDTKTEQELLDKIDGFIKL